MPDGLKAGLEQRSGIDLSSVRVRRNSSAPERLGALAFTRGTSIELGPGQERHLPHEAWHVVQQLQGRVAPTGRPAGVAVNDDARLEAEAERAGPLVQRAPRASSPRPLAQATAPSDVVQLRVPGFDDVNGPADVPEAWVTAFLQDVTHQETHLSTHEILAALDGGVLPDGVALQHAGNHFNVTFTAGPDDPVITVTTTADGNCAAHAAHAIVSRAQIAESVDAYQAPGDYVVGFRAQALLALTNDHAAVRQRIFGQLDESAMLPTTGFGPRLMGLLSPVAEEAQRALLAPVPEAELIDELVLDDDIGADSSDEDAPSMSGGITFEQLKQYEESGTYAFRSLNDADVAMLRVNKGLAPLGSAGAKNAKFITAHIKQTAKTGMISVARSASGSRGFQSGYVAVIKLAGLEYFTTDEIVTALSSGTDVADTDIANVNRAREILIRGAIPFGNVERWWSGGFPVDTSGYDASRKKRLDGKKEKPKKEPKVKWTRRHQQRYETLMTKRNSGEPMKTKEEHELDELIRKKPRA